MSPMTSGNQNGKSEASVPLASRKRSHAVRTAVVCFVASVLLLGGVAAWKFLAEVRLHPVLPPAGQIIPAEAPLRFVVTGDNRGNMSIFESLLGEVERQEFPLLIHTGDLVKKHSPQQFKWVTHEINEEQLTGRFCTVAGNHDILEHDPDVSKAYRLYKTYFGVPQYWFVCGNALFVALDTGDEKCPPEKIQWLRTVLAEHRSDYAACFVFTHCPPRDPRPNGTHCLQQGADELMEVLREYRVSALFAGHIHSYLEDNIAGIPIYITGGAGAPLYEPISGFHYLVCTVGQDGTFQIEKRAVPAMPDYDYIEYCLWTRVPWNSLAVAGCLLAVAGAVILVRIHRCEPSA